MEENVAKRFLAQFKRDVADGKFTVLDAVKGEGPFRFDKGDYEGFVNHARACIVLMNDREIMSQLNQEIADELSKHLSAERLAASSRDIKSKDGARLIGKLGGLTKEVFDDSPSLLTGKTFSECIAQYRRLVDHVESLWDDAREHFDGRRFPLCTFLSILTIEEIGKLAAIWFDLLSWDNPQRRAHKGLGHFGKDHRKKHFLGVMSGAVVNSRLDRILGKRNIKTLLQDVESGKLERLRQSCLYIDYRDDSVFLPEEAITRDIARFFVVLAGELWAEILGHFPWDFERMIKTVADFEVAIGYDPKDVALSD